MPATRYDHLDELLTRIHLVRRRPGWRRLLLADGDAVASVSTLHVLRAVEQREQAGLPASIGDVADFLAVEHSTASRMVAQVVTAGLLTKAVAAEDQRRSSLALTDVGRKSLAQVTDRRRDLVTETIAHWPDDDVDALVGLLDRLVADFERRVRR
jgi:DNA-binding MarR family transcriptional regulator